jgi:hypothetical protein
MLLPELTAAADEPAVAHIPPSPSTWVTPFAWCLWNSTPPSPMLSLLRGCVKPLGAEGYLYLELLTSTRNNAHFSIFLLCG